MRIMNSLAGRTILGVALSLSFLTTSPNASANVPAPKGKEAIEQFIARGKNTPPKYKVGNGAPANPELAKKAAMRSFIKDQRRKLYAHPKNVNKGAQPRMSTQQIDSMIKRLAEKRSGSGPATAAPRTAGVGSRSIPNSFVWDSLELAFTPYDYTAGLNYMFYQYNADPSANSVAVDFDYIDLESQYDYVEIYDYYGLCAAYTGHYSGFISEVCAGPSIQIWVVTDHNSLGGSSYNGFKINGFYSSTLAAPTSANAQYPVAVALADHYTVNVGDRVYFDGTWSYDPLNLNGTLWYQWDFGDGVKDPSYGTSSFDYTDTHTYETPGTYTVLLTVTNSAGYTAYDYIYVTVQQVPPTAQFALKASTVYIANPVVVYPEPQNRADSLYVDWGDGTAQNFSPYVYPSGGFQHLYSAAGTYQITVTADNIAGEDIAYANVTISDQQVPPIVELLNQGTLNASQGRGYSVSYDLSVRSDGTITGVDAYWGGPTTDSSYQHLSPTDLASFQSLGGYSFSLDHNYYVLNGRKKVPVAGIYDTQIVATDNAGLQSWVDYRYATKNLPPVVSKAIRAKCKGTTCTMGYFGNQATEKLMYDKDGTVVDFTFNVYRGDRTNLALECPGAQDQRQFSCTFSEAGTYYLHLTVTDNLGAKTEVWKPFRIHGISHTVVPREAESTTPPADSSEF